MVRRADDLPERALVVSDETSALTDEALAVSFAEWLADFDHREPLHLTVTAAETLAEARAAGEV